MEVPLECRDVPSEVLDPRHTWQDKAAYDEQAEPGWQVVRRARDHAAEDERQREGGGAEQF